MYQLLDLFWQSDAKNLIKQEKIHNYFKFSSKVLLKKF